MNRNVLAGTQALLDARENLFPWHRLYATSVHIGDALANLAFPCLAEIGTVEARRQGFHEFGTLARRECRAASSNRAASVMDLSVADSGNAVRCDEGTPAGIARSAQLVFLP